jgi:Transglutaminase-like superfamily
MSAIQLNPKAFACDAGGQIIFLDLGRDRYVSLDPEETEAFEAYLTPPRAPSPSLAERVRALSDQLREEGLDRRLAPADAWISAPPAAADFNGFPPGRHLKIGAGHVAHFLASAASARFQLACLPLERVVRNARRRQAALADAQAPDPQAVHDLVEIHRLLQPLVFTAHNHCLFDSLALHDFLSGYGVPARWVFGVKRHPFLAHCWVQFGDIICNDSLEHICLFHPIMEV